MKTVVLGTLALCAGVASASSDASAFLSKEEYFPHYRQLPLNDKQKSNVDSSLGHLINRRSAKDVEKYIVALGNTQASLGAYANRDLMNRLFSMRKSICAEQGFRREQEMSDCENFMGVACSLEGSGSAHSVNDATCKQFFMEDDGAAVSEVASESASETETAEAEVVAQEDNATDNTTGLFGAKKGRKLAEQGYNEYEDGKLVEHKNLHTHTEDWLAERDGRNFAVICKEFPNNQWCRMHVGQPKKQLPHHLHTEGEDAHPHHFLAEEAPPALSPPAGSSDLDSDAPAASVGFHASRLDESEEAEDSHRTPRSGTQATVSSAGFVLVLSLAARL